MYGVLLTTYEYKTDRRGGELTVTRRRKKDEVIAAFANKLDAQDYASREKTMREDLYEEVYVVDIVEVDDTEEDEENDVG